MYYRAHGRWQIEISCQFMQRTDSQSRMKIPPSIGERKILIYVHTRGKARNLFNISAFKILRF
jgi:hypothetical protein